MARNLSVLEPHPTVSKAGGYIGSGRGGAGNMKKFKPEEVSSGPDAIGPASRVSLVRAPRSLKRTVPAGRGGAGNMISGPEESIFQFDEEMMKKRQTSAPIYHIGRGGAGNLFTEAHPKPVMGRKHSTDSNVSGGSDRNSIEHQRSSMLSIFSRRS